MTSSADSTIAISWERHRRTSELCDGLSIPLYTLITPRKGLARYAELIGCTASILRRRRPRILLVQNPSLVLTVIGTLLRPVLGFRLIVDAHNEAIRPFVNTQRVVRFIASWLIRKADLTIVTNEELSSSVEQQGGRAFVLPDRLPRLTPASPPELLEGRPIRVMVVSTYAPDEPLWEIVAAAKSLGSRFVFYVTGRSDRAPSGWRESLPSNVSVTGFLPEDEYIELMRDAHVVLDLTTMPDCLVCGAYEGLAVGRPLVLSDSRCNRMVFGDVAVYTHIGVSAIVDALEQIESRYAELCAAIPQHRVNFSEDWMRRQSDLRRELGLLAGGAKSWAL